MNRCSIDGSDMIIRIVRTCYIGVRDYRSKEEKERKKETQLLLYRDEFNDNYSLDAHRRKRHS